MTAESENQMKSRMTESEAILRAREGDSLGFEYLYESHRKHVYSICLRILKNSADAEDLTEQTFLQVFRKLGTFRGESGFSTWLHRVTINTVLMHLRRKKLLRPGRQTWTASPQTLRYRMNSQQMMHRCSARLTG